MDCSTPGFPALHHLPELAQTHVQRVMPFNHLILCCPLLLLSSVFPSIRVFSSESALRIMWPKHWSFSLSISRSNEYSGLIAFGIGGGLVAKSCPTLGTPWTVRLLCPWDSSGKNIGVGCRFLLQGIFLTQKSNPGLLSAGRFFIDWVTREVLLQDWLVWSPCSSRYS